MASLRYSAADESEDTLNFHLSHINQSHIEVKKPCQLRVKESSSVLLCSRIQRTLCLTPGETTVVFTHLEKLVRNTR